MIRNPIVSRMILAIIICLVGTMVLATSSYAQPGRRGGPPADPVRSVVDGDYGEFSYTSSSIDQYDDGNDDSGPFWEAPKGTKIVQVAKKEKRHKLYILLNDGSVYEFELQSTNPPKYTQPKFIKKIDISGGSQSFDQMVVDAFYVRSSSYVYVSRDTGLTWQVDSAGLGSAYVWGIALDTTGNVYAATTNGLFFQEPDSTVWKKINSYAGPQNLYRVFVNRKNYILLGINGAGVYLSTDNGASWNIDTAGTGLIGANGFGGDVYGNLYLRTTNLYRSTGGTGPWTRIDGDITNITVNTPLYNTIFGDSTLLAGTSFGLFVSKDQGNTWHQANNGLEANQISSFAKMQGGRIFETTALGIYYQNAGEAAWTKSFPTNGYQPGLNVYQDGLDNLYTILANSAFNAYAFGSIMKSTDSGASWNPDTSGLSSTVGTVYYVDETGVQHIASSFYLSNVFALVYQKAPGGSWALDTMGFQSNHYNFSSVISSDKHGSLYLSGSYDSHVQVYRRPIGGGTWVPDTSGLSAINYFQRMTPGLQSDMFGVAGNRIYHQTSSNSGQASAAKTFSTTSTFWTQIPLPASLYFPGISAISVDSSGALFAAFTGFSSSGVVGVGVYFTTDNGVTWTHAGADSVFVTKLAAYGDTTYTVSDRGVYALTRTAPLGVPEHLTIPNAYNLLQNYPNPFNPQATIRYSLVSESRVTLRVFNTLGQLVASLVNGMQSPGEHVASFNGANLPSGVYFYRLEAAAVSDPTKSFTRAMKMVLIK